MGLQAVGAGGHRQRSSPQVAFQQAPRRQHEHEERQQAHPRVPGLGEHARPTGAHDERETGDQHDGEHRAAAAPREPQGEHERGELDRRHTDHERQAARPEGGVERPHRQPQRRPGVGALDAVDVLDPAGRADELAGVTKSRARASSACAMSPVGYHVGRASTTNATTTGTNTIAAEPAMTIPDAEVAESLHWLSVLLQPCRDLPRRRPRRAVRTLRSRRPMRGCRRPTSCTCADRARPWPSPSRCRGTSTLAKPTRRWAGSSPAPSCNPGARRPAPPRCRRGRSCSSGRPRR